MRGTSKLEKDTRLHLREESWDEGAPVGGSGCLAADSGLLPMEKGTKASLFLNCPFSSRKCWGWKSRGLEKNLGSLSTEPSIGNTSVPW